MLFIISFSDKHIILFMDNSIVTYRFNRLSNNDISLSDNDIMIINLQCYV